ncbi:MAG: HXXEE domain-containing protein [Ignavibacterium sp.]|nr:MAG: HXXEE domain-containing protein [Ignavibacterium sp.]
MSDDFTGVAIYASVFCAVLLVAILLSVSRNYENLNEQVLDGFVNRFLVGIAFQCLHFTEEFITRLYERLPQLLGMQVWSKEFFVAFNLSWIFIWSLSAVGLKNQFRPAYIPVWFFAIMMTANGIIHPLLAVAVGGYFPGLITSPIVGILGILILDRLLKMTRQESK